MGGEGAAGTTPGLDVGADAQGRRGRLAALVGPGDAGDPPRVDRAAADRAGGRALSPAGRGRAPLSSVLPATTTSTSRGSVARADRRLRAPPRPRRVRRCVLAPG